MTDQPLTRDTVIGPFPLPPIDDELRAEARGKPGEWIVFTDPMVDPNAANPPRFAIQGGYRADENGEIVDYRVNPGYEPSPARTGYDFTTGFEISLWRVLNGHHGLGPFVDSFYHAKLLSYAQHEGDQQVPVVADPEHPERSQLLLCTSATFCSWQHTHQVTGAGILDMAGGTDVVVVFNPGTSLSLRITARTLASLITDETPHLIENIRRRQRSGESPS